MAVACAIVPAIAVGQESSPTSVVAQLRTLEENVELAFLNSDAAFLGRVIRDDFLFNDAGGAVVNKTDTIVRFAAPGRSTSRTLTAVNIELHGDLAVSRGRLEVASARRNYTLCYVRVYAKSAGQWQLLSHQSVRERNGYTETCAPRED